MIDTIHKRKATLAEYAITQYQNFLITLYHTSNIPCSFPNQLLCFHFYFKYITWNEYHFLFPYKGEDCLRVTLNRMVKKGLLEQTDDIKPFHAYAITTLGSTVIQKKLPSLLQALCSLPKEKEFSFTINDILSFFKARLIKFQPSYLYHFFGIRDFYFTFLSTSLKHSNFLFLQECWIENGYPLSIYQQTLYIRATRTMKNQLIRSDGLLLYHCKTYPELDIPLYLEFDTGSQRSSILVSKVQHYLENSHYFFQECCKNANFQVHMPPSILFCMSSKYCNKKSPKPIRTLSKRNYRPTFLRIIELWDILHALEYPVLQEASPTLLSCITLFQSIHNRLLGSPSQEFLSILLKYQEEYPEDLTCTLLSIVENLEQEKETLTKTYDKQLKNYYLDSYYQRKNLLWNNLQNTIISELSTALLKGSSIFTIPYELLSEYLPVLIPELYEYSSSFIQYLADFNCYHGTISLSYEHLGTLYHYTLRNHYIVKDNTSSYHFFFENISEDFGGYLRIQTLLSLSSIHDVKEHYKIVCIVSEEFLVKYLKELVTSPLYQLLCPLFSIQWNPFSFELLFCTSADFKAGRFFLLQPNGKRIYKI